MNTSSKELLELKKEIMLHINQRLFERGTIPKDMYEQAKVKIVNLQ